jgi:hypothetical protein
VKAEDLREIRRQARAFLDGETPPVETAVALCRYHDDTIEPEALREALMAFVAVASETDAIPVGHRRALWHPDVREKEDLKHDEAQTWARPIVEEACAQILTAVSF